MSEHPLVKLARKTIETYIKEKRVLDPPSALTPEMQARAGVFVSLHKRSQLRGCIGTFNPTQINVAQEVIHNAIESATGDPRFSPVTEDELPELEISVDVLTEPRPVASAKELDAKKYGVIVKDSYNRRGLLLPDLPGVDTPEQQIEICCQKAWIEPGRPVQLYKFEVKRFH